MTVYLLLFRGVGGPVQLPVKPLREKLTEAGYQNVATYINSGNVVLKTRKGRAAMLEEVAALCKREFGFDKDIHAPTLQEWVEVIDRNPFPVPADGGRFLHAAWLGMTPKPDNIVRLKEIAVNGDGFEVVGNAAYISTPGGFSNSKLAERFDKWIGVPNTARNWNTVLKMRELGEKAG
ncbi:MAG: DUF1697 domain-containing protein [Mesorhizobium sp.]